MWSTVVVLVLCLILSIHTLQLGDLCETSNGTNGICGHLVNCTTAIKEVHANGRPKICNFEGIDPIVCCEVNKSSVNVPLVSSKPENNTIESIFGYIPFDENNRSLRRCRNIHPVFGDYPPSSFLLGRNMSYQDSRHMAVLGYGEPDNIQWECGGALVSNEFVLTAAHCLHSRLFGKLRFIRLGDLYLNSTIYDEVSQDFTVKEIYPHPNYTTLSIYHDIALVRLDRSINVTDYVKPTCLGITKNLTKEEPEVQGWGLTSNGSDYVNTLNSNYLSLVSNEKCREIYGTSDRYEAGIVDEFQVCTDRAGLQEDTCRGDSGGPLEIRNSHYYFNYFQEIVAVASFSKRCAGVYTRVYPYVSWIENIVWPKE